MYRKNNLKKRIMLLKLRRVSNIQSDNINIYIENNKKR